MIIDHVLSDLLDVQLIYIDLVIVNAKQTQYDHKILIYVEYFTKQILAKIIIIVIVIVCTVIKKDLLREYNHKTSNSMIISVDHKYFWII